MPVQSGLARIFDRRVAALRSAKLPCAERRVVVLYKLLIAGEMDCRYQRPVVRDAAVSVVPEACRRALCSDLGRGAIGDGERIIPGQWIINDLLSWLHDGKL